MTSNFHPLDVGVNGIIKEEGKKFMNEEAIDEILNLFDSQKGHFEGQISIIDAISKKYAAAVLYCIWDNISEFTFMYKKYQKKKIPIFPLYRYFLDIRKIVSDVYNNVKINDFSAYKEFS